MVKMEVIKADQAHGEDLQSLIQTFLEIVRAYFRGLLKLPFNVDTKNAATKNAAGFGPHWYEPMAGKVKMGYL